MSDKPKPTSDPNPHLPRRSQYADAPLEQATSSDGRSESIRALDSGEVAEAARPDTSQLEVAPGPSEANAIGECLQDAMLHGVGIMQYGERISPRDILDELGGVVSKDAENTQKDHGLVTGLFKDMGLREHG